MSGIPNLLLYVQKLERQGPLSTEARQALMSTPARIESFLANVNLVREGDRPSRCCLVVDGFVNRYRTLKDGSRQILSFHVPGDMVDLQNAIIAIADHGIRTNSLATIVSVDNADIVRLAEEHPELLRAFWFDTMVDAAIFREWTVNVGQRSAVARTAHLILEIAEKMRMAGLNTDGTFSFPFTQSDLADAVGITSVHLNRVFQKLRTERMIRTHMRKMNVEDEKALGKLAGFSPIYLHPEGPRRFVAPLTLNY